MLLYRAVIATEVGCETRLVATVKLTEVAPCGTRMLAGTVAMLVLLLAKRIVAPPAGAGALNVTVPVETEPPRTVAGLSSSEASVGSGPGGGVGVRVGVGSGATVGVGDADEAPIPRVAVTFELL